MTPVVTVFEASPDQGRGLARDMRVRWALEEVGQAYETRGVSFAQLKKAGHLARNPFGQIPTLEDGELTLFESGAIVLRVAERHGGLLPDDADGRARAIVWMFAALSTVEPPVVECTMVALFERDAPWFEARLAKAKEQAKAILRALADHLGTEDWLDGAFSAGDLMMVTVLMRADTGGLLGDFSTLAAYVARAEARPAFRRAFEAQRAAYLASQAGAV